MIPKHLKPKFKLYSLVCLLSVVFISESVGARTTVEIAQIAQQETTQQDAIRDEAVRLIQEGTILYDQGTTVSLKKAIVKLEQALKIWKKLEDKQWQAITFLGFGTTYAKLGEYQKALSFLNQALSLFRATGDKDNETGTLNAIETITQLATRAEAKKLAEEATKLLQQGTAVSLKQATVKFEQALKIWKKLGDKRWQAITFLGFGHVYHNLGEKQKALSFYNQALPLFRAVGDKDSEATTLKFIEAITQRVKAEKLTDEAFQLFKQGTAVSLKQATVKFEQALKLWKKLGHKRWQGVTFLGIGSVYLNLGEKQKALSFYNQALPLFRAVSDKDSEAATLKLINEANTQQGKSSSSDATRVKAEKLTQEGTKLLQEGTTVSLKQATVRFEQAVGDKDGEATTLKLIEANSQQGKSSPSDATLAKAKKLTQEGAKLFQQGTAVSLKQATVKFEQALKILEKLGNKPGQALLLLGIGKINYSLGEKHKALEYYNQALPILRALKAKKGEATALAMIAGVYVSSGNKQKALEFFNQALPLIRAVKDKKGEAAILNNIGYIYTTLGDKQKALEYYNQALPILRAVENEQVEATALTSMGYIYASLGEKHKALGFLNQALPLIRAVKDKKREATALAIIGGVYVSSGEKQKALKFLNQALPLARAVKDKKGEASTLAIIGDIYNDLGNKQKALEFFNQALPIFRAVKDKKGEAKTLTSIGLVYSDFGHKQKALKLYNQALPLTRAVKDKKGEATTLTSIGLVYSDLGDKQKTLKFLNQALPLIRAVKDKKGKATILTNIGLVYNYLGDKQKALEFFNQALLIFRAVKDKKGEAVTFNSIGNVYGNLGDKQKALEFLNQALPLTRVVRDKALEATTLNNIGLVYNDLGNKQKALEFFNQALPLTRAVRDKAQEATTLNNIGLVYNNLGEKQKALEYHNQALPIFRAVEGKQQEATTLTSIGLVYASSGDNQKALEYYNQALPIFREMEDKQGEATTFSNIGDVYASSGDNQKALEYYNQALPIFREVKYTRGEAVTLNGMGYIYTSLKDNQKALEYFNQALPIFRAVGDRGGEATIFANLAELERKKGNLQASLKHIQGSIQIIEELRDTYTNQDLKTIYFATVQGHYKLYIDLLMELHKKKPSKGYNALAIHISERSRARGLLELLTESHADIRKGANPKLLQREEELQTEIDAKEILRSEILNQPEANQAAVDKLKQQIDKLESEYKQLQTRIKTSNPKYASLKYPDPLTLPEIQKQLDKDTILLQYSLGEKRSFLWAVTPTSVDTYELPSQQNIEKAASRFHATLQQASANELSISEAKKLSQMILAPVADKLPGKRLVIVADGGLQTIPFAALADVNRSHLKKGDNGGSKQNHSSKNPISQYQPLMINHEIVNLPSASTIAIQRQQLANRKSAPKTLAILADPVYSADDERVTGKPANTQLAPELELETSFLKRTRGLKRDGIDRLKYTEDEAKGILNLIPDDKTLEAFDFDANYTWATSSTLNQFRILHFATHGFVDQDQPEKSGLILSLFNKKGNRIKGYLELKDLFNQDYPADLIVLSACETGLGKQINGEGLVGLTRGLMYAGGERIVVSLWQVNDMGTSVLMQEFYQQMLNKGKNPVDALRAAQKKLWEGEEWRSPYYWAGFTLQGEWRSKR